MPAHPCASERILAHPCAFTLPIYALCQETVLVKTVTANRTPTGSPGSVPMPLAMAVRADRPPSHESKAKASSTVVARRGARIPVFSPQPPLRLDEGRPPSTPRIVRALRQYVRKGRSQFGGGRARAHAHDATLANMQASQSLCAKHTRGVDVNSSTAHECCYPQCYPPNVVPGCKSSTSPKNLLRFAPGSSTAR